jgi:hypothetical protein
VTIHRSSNHTWSSAAPEGKALRISSTLDPRKEVVLVDFLHANAYNFA